MMSIENLPCSSAVYMANTIDQKIDQVKIQVDPILSKLMR